MAQRAKPSGSPVIRHTPGVCGGDACIGDHRIPVWVVESLRRFGLSEDELLEDYPTLTGEELAAAYAYAAEHADEIDANIRENETA